MVCSVPAAARAPPSGVVVGFCSVSKRVARCGSNGRHPCPDFGAAARQLVLKLLLYLVITKLIEI